MRLILLTLTMAMSICGCTREADESPEVLPRVKCYTVSERAVGQSRRLSGKVVAAESSPLSFAVAGKVSQVLVSQGDKVTQGQVLATLDEEPLRLAVEQSRAQLVIAREKVVNTKLQFERATKLRSQNAGTPLELDTATTEYASAQANLRLVQAELDRKELDLKRAELAAPYAGHIAQRSIEPFEEVTAGKQAFLLQSAGSYKVEVRVPETLIRNVDHGQLVQIDFPTLKEVRLTGVVATIGTQAESGNAFPVEIRLPASDIDVRAGMTASVTFDFAQQLEGRTVYMIPLSAVAIEAGLLKNLKASNEGQALKTVPVYLFDHAAGRVKAVDIVVGDLRGNMLEVYEGLKPGDKVITAGVAFLRDQMKAELWTAEKGLNDG